MNISKKICSKTAEINESISNNPIIKGLIDGGLSLVPFFGSAIISSLNERSNQLLKKNSEKFCEELKKITETLDENKINPKLSDFLSK